MALFMKVFFAVSVYRGLRSAFICFHALNPIAFRKAKIICNFGLSECIRVKRMA